MTAFVDLARSLAERPRRVSLYGAPEGYDAAAIGDVVAEGHVLPWLHVCRDDGRMARFAAALEFFHPELDALTMAYNAVQQGASGVDMGRNIFQSEAPKAMIAAVGAVVHKNMKPKEAFDLFQSLKTDSERIVAETSFRGAAARR